MFSVSILVFVEVALGLYIAEMPDSPDAGFNPCFRGSRPRTVTIKGAGALYMAVSTLVFVEVALGLNS